MSEYAAPTPPAKTSGLAIASLITALLGVGPAAVVCGHMALAKIKKSGGTMGGGDISLYTAQTLQEYRSSRDVYYTHIFQDMMESLDHVLVSEEFYDNSRRRLWVFDGMTVNNDHLNFDDHKESGTNDHGIICARFRYDPL